MGVPKSMQLGDRLHDVANDLESPPKRRWFFPRAVYVLVEISDGPFHCQERSRERDLSTRGECHGQGVGRRRSNQANEVAMTTELLANVSFTSEVVRPRRAVKTRAQEL